MRESKGKLEIVVKTGLHHTLSTWDTAEFSVDLPNDEDAPNDEEEGNDDEGEDDDEAANLAALERGASGYNEARGYDTEEPEPCGQHCDWSCPRCGG